MSKIQMKLSIFKALLFQASNYGQITTRCTLSRAKIHRPEIFRVPKCKSRVVQLPS